VLPPRAIVPRLPTSACQPGRSALSYPSRRYSTRSLVGGQP
jgi:hypothetical protein